MSWETVTLEKLCNEITVGHVGPMADKYLNDGILFLRSQNIEPFKLNLSSNQIKYISTDFHSKLSKSKLNPGDIVIVRTGYPGTCCVIPNEIVEANCADLVIARPKKDVDAKFITYYINSPLGRGTINGNLVGVAQKHFNVGVAKRMIIPLPLLPTQKKIASILSAYDDLIENNLKRIKLLEEAAQNIYKEWFVNFRFPGWENAKFDEESGLPEGWRKQLLANNIQTVKRKPKLKKDFYLDEGKYPIIDQGDGYIAGYTNDEELVQKTPLPLVVFGDHTRRIKFINFPFVSGADGTQLIYPKNEKLLPSYFYHAIKSIDLSNYAYARHFKFLKEQEIILPDSTILDRFNNLTSTMNNQIIKLINYNQKLKEARDILLPRLMNQTIEV